MIWILLWFYIVGLVMFPISMTEHAQDTKNNLLLVVTSALLWPVVVPLTILLIFINVRKKSQH